MSHAELLMVGPGKLMVGHRALVGPDLATPLCMCAILCI